MLTPPPPRFTAGGSLRSITCWAKAGASMADCEIAQSMNATANPRDAATEARATKRNTTSHTGLKPVEATEWLGMYRNSLSLVSSHLWVRWVGRAAELPSLEG